MAGAALPRPSAVCAHRSLRGLSGISFMFRLFCRAAVLAAVPLSSALSSQTGTFVSYTQPLLLGANTAADPVVLDTVIVTGQRVSPSLTVLDAEEARQEMQRVPGGVSLVDADEWRDTPARTLKDVLDYTPGVFVQPKWGEDARLSIRGSGLSRNFHLRGVQLLVDGIPMNAADGSADFQEIDPTAFAYTEVYKGANALRYGANSLGGAINFVSATGITGDQARLRVDGGSFDLRRGQLGGGGHYGSFDAYATGSYLENRGFRDHSGGESKRFGFNVGWRITPNVETRLYAMGADIEQRIPGTVTREAALSDPKPAALTNVNLDYQRNMQSWRVASKTTAQFGAGRLELGGYLVEKQLIHPIFQYLDYQYDDSGVFARASFDAQIAGHANRFIIGANLFNGHIDNQQFRNLPGAERGELLSASKDESRNLTLYVENQFDLKANLTLVTGLQFSDARRERRDRLDDATDTSGRQDYDFTSPKLGVIWQATPQAQMFANVSRSAEAPTFGELNFTNTALSDTRAQRATTVEVGTRGATEMLSWDVSVYRAYLRNEFQFFDLGGGNFQVTNADQTVHQGFEAGLGWIVARGLLSAGDEATWKLAYAFNDFFFDNDPHWGSNNLPGAPRHFIRSELHYAHVTGFYVAPNVEWVPEGFDVDNANTVQTRRYALLGLRVGYQRDTRWSVYVDARNLTNERYIASTSAVAKADPNSAIFEPGDGLAVFAGVNVNIAR
jgi:iron complex outermembrane recepter protein